MRASKRILSAILSIVLVVGLCPAPAFAGEAGLGSPSLAAQGVDAGAALATQSASHTRDEAVSWARSQIGKWLDYDRAYGAQCVDLTKYYYDYLGVGSRTGNGYAYVNGNLPGGWSRSSSPEPGDVAAWAAGKGAAGSAGHVAIVVEVSGSRFTVVEQSGNTTACRYNTYATNNPSNFLRPDWPSPAPEPVRGSEMAGGYDRTIPDGDYAIVLTSTLGSDTFYYLDIIGSEATAANGTNVNLWSSSGNPANLPGEDLWTVKYQDGFYSIMQKGAGVALDVNGASLDEGANVQAWGANTSSAQKWAISTNGDGYRLEAKCSGFSLDLSGVNIANGTNIQMWSDNDSAAQRWSFVPVGELCQGRPRTIPDGDYAIVLTSTLGSDTFYYADIVGVEAPAAEGVNVQLYSAQGDPAKLPAYDLWTVKYQDGFYSITQKGTNTALDVSGASLNQGANVQAWSSNTSSAQRWAISENGDGYRLEAKCSGYSLDLNGANVQNGANIQMWSDNDSIAQRWSFVPVNIDSASKWTVKAKKNIAKATVSKVKAKKYTGKAIKPKPKVTFKGKLLERGIDYTLKYKNNKKVGKATIIVKGKGSFKGSLKTSFAIKANKSMAKRITFYAGIYNFVSPAGGWRESIKVNDNGKMVLTSRNVYSSERSVFKFTLKKTSSKSPAGTWIYRLRQTGGPTYGGESTIYYDSARAGLVLGASVFLGPN